MDELWWLEAGAEAGPPYTRSTTQTSTSQFGGQEDSKHIGGTFLTSTNPVS